MRHHIVERLLGYGLLAAAMAACGSEAADKAAPPPITGGTSDTVFALESGVYYVSTLHDLQDGCAKMDSRSPLTQVAFNLTNDGNSAVTIDFCSYESTSVHGVVHGNAGTLAVIHNGRRTTSGNPVGEYDQDCRIDVQVKADNKFEGHYVETQRNMNAAARDARGLSGSECTTSFTFNMEKRP